MKIAEKTQKDKGLRCDKHFYSRVAETNHRTSLTYRIQESSCAAATWELSPLNKRNRKKGDIYIRKKIKVLFF